VSGQAIDAEAVLADLKDFQRRTARWAFQRMFDEEDPAVRFLVADEVGLGKTHVAKGVIAQVIDFLGQTGDKRHDIVYVCSNLAIASQNVRKLAPGGVKPLGAVSRLTMLPLAQLDEGDETRRGVNLLAITPGTSLQFGRRTGTFSERALAYSFLRSHWGADVMSSRPAKRIFWHGIRSGDPGKRLLACERWYRRQIAPSLGNFRRRLDAVDVARASEDKLSIRGLFDEIVGELAYKRAIPRQLYQRIAELIGEVRRVMALVGLDSLQPDLVVLDEFQRFKDLLQTEPDSLAAEMAQQLFNYTDPDTGRSTRTLLLSATPYRMYTTADDLEGDHYEDFLATCSFLYGDPVRVERLQSRFRALRAALTSRGGSLVQAEEICHAIGDDLRGVMARTERLAATPCRDGMLQEPSTPVEVKPVDLQAYVRLGSLAEAVAHHEPTDYWKSAPYLVNFMEAYKLKEAVARAVEIGDLDNADLDPGPGLLNWHDIETYERVDPQNARLRWLLEELADQRAFELLWVPASMRYYDAGSVYESPTAAGFTKRLIFSGWTVVPKVISSLVSFEAERRAFEARRHNYTADYGRRGGGRLDLRTSERTAERRPGESAGDRRAAAMTAFILAWPSPSLAELGDPRPIGTRRTPPLHGISEPGRAGVGAAGERPRLSELIADTETRIGVAIEPLIQAAPAEGPTDQRWYWAAPLLLDGRRHPSAVDFLFSPSNASYWEGDRDTEGLRAHLNEGSAIVAAGVDALGRPPDDLIKRLTELAVGGPAQCALRAISSVVGLDISHAGALANAAWVGAAFRNFFSAPETTAVVVGGSGDDAGPAGPARYWQEVLRHCIDGNLQAVLDEHCHVLRDWLGFLNIDTEDRRVEAADDIASKLANALDLRTSSYRVDIPGRERHGPGIELHPHRMRSRFAVAFGHQTLDQGGEARIEAVSKAFNSPFWPFVLASTSIGQEGLDFHLWCHAVVHWNLPANPVDLEQREGRVHRYKGHAVRRNIATTFGPDLLDEGLAAGADPWNTLFELAVAAREANDDEMVPYWVFHQGTARIERLVPNIPFSREAAALPRLRKTLAAYRLAFGQPRQAELVELLGRDFTSEDLQRLRIDLSPPEASRGAR
jgi:hypothetical protein